MEQRSPVKTPSLTQIYPGYYTNGVIWTTTTTTATREWFRRWSPDLYTKSSMRWSSAWTSIRTGRWICEIDQLLRRSALVMNRIKLIFKVSGIHMVKCENCQKWYICHTGRKLSAWMDKYEIAIRRHDPLSLISVHKDLEGYAFNRDMVFLMDQANTKYSRDYLGPWHLPTNSINRFTNLD